MQFVTLLNGTRERRVRYRSGPSGLSVHSPTPSFSNADRAAANCLTRATSIIDPLVPPFLREGDVQEMPDPVTCQAPVVAFMSRAPPRWLDTRGSRCRP
jgi:hypothetical protein